ncbi:hypothetical protein CVU75_00490 [Candidatus Dependentiae bacterium HGW-Dependentiae-1]|nr:MAG: hypothetical protein CVU75_00490 [Candidatus Dependentiae bacterium HGW-Dependentiae-1]
MRYLLFCLGLALSVQVPLTRALQERITSFESDITVHVDSSLTVRETITVFSLGQSIIHGIVREFPTRYTDYLGTRYEVFFDVHQVRHNGLLVAHSVHDVANGKKIYIGDSSTRIALGEHTYSIVYTTKRQLGFFPDHDELYWNVTGNGWRLPIEKVRATVHLPEASQAQSAQAYTGFQGERGNDYTQIIEGSNVIFSTTRPFTPFEGFTLVVTWPKGVVLEPTSFEKISWFFKDNWALLLIMLGLLAIWGLAVRCWFLSRRANKPGTVIPLFYPSEGLMPSAIGFMKNRSWKDSLFGADIVDLAVRGYLTIEHKKTVWSGAQYTLVATQKFLDGVNLTKRDSAVLTALFSSGNAITIARDNRENVTSALHYAQQYCKAAVGDYIQKMNFFLYNSFIIVGMVGFLIVFFGGTFDPIFMWTLVPLIGALALLFSCYRVYTSKGRKLQDEIDGFQMYLETAEAERMKIIGTPPTKTPELYETYLPYAMALGVEEQWGRQFAPIFERLEREGHPYVPLWYHGHRFSADVFASQFGSSFNNAISSATTPPGSSSGSGGRGSSGGGGGGGGGGGW